MELLDIEQDRSNEFYICYLSTVRCLIAVYDATIYKDDFIMLPGDEITEKKHKNIKFLTAMDGGGDLSRQKTRKFAGLGAPVFKVDFGALFPDQYGKKEEGVTASQVLDKEEPEIKEKKSKKKDIASLMNYNIDIALPTNLRRN